MENSENKVDMARMSGLNFMHYKMKKWKMNAQKG